MTPAAIVDFLAEREGIARGRSLLRAGASRDDLRRAVACGAVERPRTGVYCTPRLASVQLATCLGDEAFFAAFESAWHLGLLGETERAEVRAGLRAGQRSPTDIARADAESGLESILRLRLLRRGIAVECQVRIDGVGRVDFLVDGILIVGSDG